MKPNYFCVDDRIPKRSWFEQFIQVMKRGFSLELFKGLMLTAREYFFEPQNTVIFPKEKMDIGGRYRAVHRLLRLLESGNERCIGCGLCEKICVANCIRMDTKIDENSRKEVTDYTINFGRCIFCGYCADVCPELAIVHGNRYENASEQRSHYAAKDDMLTPIDKLLTQEEFIGFGSLNNDANTKVKKTPLEY